MKQRESAQSRWLRLDELLQRPRRGRRRLAPDEATELARLYRDTAADLAVARRNEPDSQKTAYLNDLVMRAHSRLYTERSGSLRAAWVFLRDRFPNLVRDCRRLILLATAIFLLGTAIGFVAVTWDPNLAEALVPKGIREAVADPRSGELASLGMSPELSTQIMLNNIQVGILAFGLGLTFGVGTTYVLLSNGLTLGALAAVYHKASLGTAFWATILPHGVIELTAIMISGAAGFVLSGALIRPGLLPRRQALSRVGGTALGLALGTIPMYVVAGTIEGFVTPRGIGYGAKYAVAAVTAVLLVPYLVRLRRRTTAAPAA